MRKPLTLTWPVLGAIAATRGMLGAGIGMLVADHLPVDRRRRIGRTLLAVGLLSTAPLIARVVRRNAAALPSDVGSEHLMLDRHR